jgi:hypothetical protein
MVFQSMAKFVGGGGEAGLVSVLNLTAVMLRQIWNDHNAARKVQMEGVNMDPVQNFV